MNNEKRRRARVQGGWCPPTNVRSDKDKPKSQPCPAWTNKTVDNPQSKNFTFEEPEEVRMKPPEKVLSKSGVYDLSETSNGLSRIRLFTDFFKSDQADWMFEQLLDELPWKQRSHRFQSEKYLEPRLTAWYGELPYTYSGTTLQPNPEWSPALQVIKQQLEERTGYTFNSMLANLYRDGHDSIDWHSDDEKSLGPAPVIASLSFGDSRNFELRKKPPTAENGDYTYMEHVRVPVTHGCLIIMEGATQADWQHRVPKEYHDRDPRINLTFRVIYSES
ncbi:alpha-ketoglutarate-dependent dioxygenase alkB homolog 3-like isoform X1 [Tubulanus polymorphus]|uniref:alpha-ketoglutarate-dependent dioxygenase alkB homolog 3-like isoform X1 n=1 Tax=Tubulanus polymorphus TaxID=672921 RepID=UPI003DA54BC0